MDTFISTTHVNSTIQIHRHTVTYKHYVRARTHTRLNLFSFSDWLDGCCWNYSTASFGTFRFTRANSRWLKLQPRQEIREYVIPSSPAWRVVLWFFWNCSLVYCCAFQPIWEISPMTTTAKLCVRGAVGQRGSCQPCKIPLVITLQQFWILGRTILTL